MSAAEKSSMKKYKFEAKVDQVLKLMIHSLYKNKEIFLRELISNASDALDKLRYLSIEKPELIEDGKELCISISNSESTMLIRDNGIGMDKNELVENLGTLAHSGTQRFMESLKKDNVDNLIGQFGVGFYSAFIVAKKVIVRSRKVGENDTYMWVSDASGSYEVGMSDKKLDSSGTEVELILKKDETEFLDEHRISNIVSRYSDHIAFPIKYINDKNEETVLNKVTALWMRPKSEITDEEYKEFYNHIGHINGEPWVTMHNKLEGIIEYTSLIYIPKNKPFDLFHPDRKTSVKLYVKRVFITDEGIDLVPQYLRFLRGVVDTEDIPLNISRETLQHNNVVKKISTSIVTQVLKILREKMESDKEGYANFWNNFGEVLKEGLCEVNFEKREEILGCCHFYTSKSNDNLISLSQYIDNLPKDSAKKKIYYITGDDLESMKNNPHLEGFKKKDIEVLLLNDHVDNFWVNVIGKYKEYEFISATDSAAASEIDKEAEAEDKEKDQDVKEVKNPIIDFIKDVLGEKVKEVRPTGKLVDSPVCLTMPSGGMNSKMEKIFIAQKQLAKPIPKILEINLSHPIIKKLESLKNDSEEKAKGLIQVLYNQAKLLAGEDIEEVSKFVHSINLFLS